MSSSSTTSSEALQGRDAQGLVAELGSAATGAGKRGRLAVAVLFFGICAGTGAVDLLWPAPARRPVGEEAREQSRLAEGTHFWDGTLAQKVELDLDLTSRVKSAVLPIWSAALYGALGEVRGDVVAGSDDWLYLRDRISFPKGDPARRARLPANFVAALRRRLAAAGCRLVAMPVPAKGSVHSGDVPLGSRTGRAQFRAFLDALAARRVPHVDLLKPMLAHAGDPVFARTDSHWSHTGALLAAGDVARATGLFVPPDERTSITTVLTRIADAGDTLRQLGVDIGAAQKDTLTRRLLDVGGRLRETDLVVVGNRARTALAIFPPNPDADVVIAGTSYSGAADFPRFVAHCTENRVRVAPFPGRGGIGAVGSALVSGLRGKLPRTLVWEFPAFPFFTRPEPFTTAGAMFALCPPGEQRPLPGPVWKWAGDRELEPGPVPLAPTATAVLFPGQLVASGDGLVSVRLRGRVSGRALSVQLLAGGISTEIPWLANQEEIVVPLVGNDLVSGAALVFQGDDGPGGLELTSIETVTDVVQVPIRARALRDVSAIDGGWTATLAFELSEPLPAGAALSIAATGAVELEVLTGRDNVLRKRLRQARLALIALPGTAGATRVRVAVKGVGHAGSKLPDVKLWVPGRGW